MKNITLKKRIIDLSKQENLSHLGSCLTTADILSEVYKYKKDDEAVILDNGHAGLALYCVLEEHQKTDPVKLLHNYGIHPKRDLDNGIHVSTGSLGLGAGIGLGYALSDKKNVYIISSDGSLMEGIHYETLRNAARHNLTNYKLIVNCNGYSALDEVTIEQIQHFLQGLGWGVFITDSTDEIPQVLAVETDIPIAILVKTNFEFPFLQGVDAHYMTMTEEDYTKATSLLN